MTGPVVGRASLIGLALLSVALIGFALLAGASGGRQLWTAILIMLGLIEGAAIGTLWERALVAEGRPEPSLDDPVPQLARRFLGSGARWAVFAGATAFAAVQAHAIGAGVDVGAPTGSVALLLPPIVIAALALRSASRSPDGSATKTEMTHE